MDWITILSILGSVASLIGLPFAIYSIRQARNAARSSEKEARASKEASQQAQVEIERFRNDMKLISNIVNFERALMLMDDIKSLIRQANFALVPDRISTLITLLNALRAPSLGVGEAADAQIQESVRKLRKIEDDITRSLLSKEDQPQRAGNFSRIISEQIDLLHPLLISLRDRIGERND
jgi:hypothetical protein